MKKFLTLVAGLLVAGYLGLTYLAGSNFNKQLALLEANLAQEPNVTLVEAQKTGGFFSSSGLLSLEIDLHELEDELTVTLNAPWQANHLAGWVNFASQLEVSVSDGYDTLNFNELLGLPSFDLTGTAGLKKLNYQQAITQLASHNELVNLDVAVSDWLISGEIYYSGKETGQFNLGSFKLTGDSHQELSLSNLQASFNQSGKFPWQAAKWLVSLENFKLNDYNQQLNLNQAELALDYQLSQSDFTLNQALSFNQLQVANLEITQAQLKTQLSQLNSQALGKLLKLVKEQQLSGTANLEEDQLEELFIQLLADSPKLTLEELSFNLNQPFAMNPSAEGWVEFNGENLPADFIEQLETSSFDEDEMAARLTLELKIAKLPSLVLALMGLPKDALGENKDELLIKLNEGRLFINEQQIF